jgi:hypothetical protein
MPGTPSRDGTPLAMPAIPAMMIGLVFDESKGEGLGLALVELPKPVPLDGEALVKVLRAGICSTVLIPTHLPP